MDDFGPLTNVAAGALSLVALFASLVPRAIGKLNSWAALADRPPNILTLAPARILSVVVMAISYVTIDSRTRWIWMTIAAGSAIALMLCVFRFDHMRRLHIASIPEVGADGRPLVDAKGQPVVRNVVIGSESKLRLGAAGALEEARRKGGVSLRDFMAGYGVRLNDPSTLWEDGYLVRVATGLARYLTAIVLFGVVGLFLAALILDTA